MAFNKVTLALASRVAQLSKSLNIPDRKTAKYLGSGNVAVSNIN